MRGPRHLPTLLLSVLLVAPACGGGATRAAERLPDCEWCGAAEAPAELDAEMRLAGPGSPFPDEPGEPLVITGTVYEADGETPAAGVLIYAYHTNAEGIYETVGGETGNGLRHGHLRGWLRTGDDGGYRIVTIRPGVYPSRNEPAHVHMTVTPPGGEEEWIDSIHFDDDPLLDAGERAGLRGRGGSGVVTLRRDEDGILRARRDVMLEF